MKIIIPVAGVGKRLRPHTHSTPKPLINLAGKPVIGHILENLKNLKVEELILVVSEKGEEIVKVSSQFVPWKISYALQREQKGLGHAVYQAKDRIDKNDEVLIVLGDTIVEGPIERAIGEGDDFIGVKRVEDPKRFGVIELGKDGRIIGVEEKPDNPKSNWAIVGVYYFTDSEKLFESLEYVIEKNIKTKGEYQLTDALALMLEGGWRPRLLEIEGWYDCGKVDALLDTHRILVDRNRKARNYSNATIIHPVYIEEGVEIENSVVGPYVTCGEGVKIRSSVITDSIIGEETYIENTVLSRSLIGKRVNIRGVGRKFNLGDDSQVEMA
jgi:glucose-1-phosphate thymidylyltransferase